MDNRVFDQYIQTGFPSGKGPFPPWGLGTGTAGRLGHCLRRWPQRLRGARSSISTLREAVLMYASAQALAFLAITENPSLPNRNLAGRGICLDVSGWTQTKVKTDGHF